MDRFILRLSFKNVFSKVRSDPSAKVNIKPQHSHGKRKSLWLETIIIGLKTNPNCRVIVCCHLHSHKYFQKFKKIIPIDVNSPGRVHHHSETGETNIIFAPGLSSNKYFGCWAQTKWPWPPAALLGPAKVSSVWMGKNNNKLVFCFYAF